MKNQEKTNPVVITVKQFCDTYQMSHSGFYAMCANGNGPPTIKMGRKRLISLAAIPAWLEGMTENKKKKGA